MSFKTDVYMFGCLIYEVLTGEDPFFWLDTLMSFTLYRQRNLSNPLDAAAAEGKLSYVMADSPVRSALELLSKCCMKQAPEERPDMEGVLASLDDMHKKRALIEAEAKPFQDHDCRDSAIATMPQVRVSVRGCQCAILTVSGNAVPAAGSAFSSFRGLV